MKITNNEPIRQIKPREYREYAKLEIEPGDRIYRISDHGYVTWNVGFSDITVYRAVQKKDGKPLGHWILGHSPYGSIFFGYYAKNEEVNESGI